MEWIKEGIGDEEVGLCWEKKKKLMFLEIFKDKTHL